MIQPQVQKRIVLAGRVFVPAGESTVEHDIEVMRLMRAAGLEVAAGRVEGESEEEFGWRALSALIESGSLLPLVACLIVPEAQAPRRPGRLVRLLERAGIVRHESARGGWSPALQAETVEFLKGLDEPRDKDQVYALVAQLLLPFLTGVLGSWRLSQRSPGSPGRVTPNGSESGPSAGATTAPGEG